MMDNGTEWAFAMLMGGLLANVSSPVFAMALSSIFICVTLLAGEISEAL